MKLVSILIFLLSQSAIADVTTKKTNRESCTGSACSVRQDAGALKRGPSPSDSREPPKQEEEGPHPSAGAGGEPPGSSYKNQIPKQDKSSPQPSAGAGGEPPGASYKNLPPPTQGDAPK